MHANKKTNDPSIHYDLPTRSKPKFSPDESYKNLNLSFSDSHHSTINHKDSHISVRPWDSSPHKQIHSRPHKNPNYTPKNVTKRKSPETVRTSKAKKGESSVILMTNETTQNRTTTEQSFGKGSLLDISMEVEGGRRKHNISEMVGMFLGRDGLHLKESPKENKARVPLPKIAKKKLADRTSLSPIFHRMFRQENRRARIEKTYGNICLTGRGIVEPSRHRSQGSPEDAKEQSYLDLYRMMQDVSVVKTQEKRQKEEVVPNMFLRDFDAKRPRLKPRIKIDLQCWREPEKEVFDSWGQRPSKLKGDPQILTQKSKLPALSSPYRGRFEGNLNASQRESPQHHDFPHIEALKKKVGIGMIIKNECPMNDLIKIRMMGSVLARKNSIGPEAGKIDLNMENKKKKAFEIYIKPLKDISPKYRISTHV